MEVKTTIAVVKRANDQDLEIEATPNPIIEAVKKGKGFFLELPLSYFSQFIH